MLRNILILSLILDEAVDIKRLPLLTPACWGRSVTQNEDGYELLAVLVFILGTPLGLLLDEEGGETEHFRLEIVIVPPQFSERRLIIVPELNVQAIVCDAEHNHGLP